MWSDFIRHISYLNTFHNFIKITFQLAETWVAIQTLCVNEVNGILSFLAIELHVWMFRKAFKFYGIARLMCYDCIDQDHNVGSRLTKLMHVLNYFARITVLFRQLWRKRSFAQA